MSVALSGQEAPRLLVMVHGGMACRNGLYQLPGMGNARSTAETAPWGSNLEIGDEAALPLSSGKFTSTLPSSPQGTYPPPPHLHLTSYIFILRAATHGP